MGCCPRQFGEFFEQGIGKFLLVLCLLLITYFVAYFTIGMISAKTAPADNLIPLKLDQDFFISKNDSGYLGYIRFEPPSVPYLRLQKEKYPTVKIVLQFKKDAQFKHSIKIEFFDKNNSFISDLLLRKESFAPLFSGYSYNTLSLELPKEKIDNLKFFRYSFIKD